MYNRMMFQCNNCKKVFTTKQRLQSHNNRKFKCAKLETVQQEISNESTVPELEEIEFEMEKEVDVSVLPLQENSLENPRLMENSDSNLIDDEKVNELLKKYLSPNEDKKQSEKVKNNSSNLLTWISLGLVGVVGLSFITKGQTTNQTTGYSI